MYETITYVKGIRQYKKELITNNLVCPHYKVIELADYQELCKKLLKNK
jgi:hypothetical protein